MPAYNSAATIGEAIHSVLAQTLQDFELLVIDDGSSDSTTAVCAGIGDDRVRVFSFENGGPAASRNRGIGRARGKLIAFLDADDVWLPDKLRFQVDALAEHPDAALVYSWIDCVDDHGQFLRHGVHIRAEGQVYSELLSRNFVVTTSSPMVRKEAFDEVGLFDERYRIGEDWDMWLRVADRFPFACVPRVHVHYRVRGDSMMSNVADVFDSTIEILRRGLARLPPSPRRDEIERAATGRINRYLAVRLIETGDSRAHAVDAGRFWWSFVRNSPLAATDVAKALVLGGAIVLMLILPPAWFGKLRSRIATLRRWRART
jgi:glycosyltransferase involved in cell wall biosynthesis